MSASPPIPTTDGSNMYRHMAALGAELRTAWRASEALTLPPGHFASLVIAGMGGSAAGGDYVAAIADYASPVPVEVVRGYALPGHARAGTLVVVVSYSGKTREALACYRHAREAGAAVMAITRGGPLGALAAEDATPTWPIAYDSPPRASLPHVLAPLLRIGNLIGATDISDATLCAAADAHAEVVARIGLEAGPDSPARKLASATTGRWPVLIAAEHLSGATRRTRNQLAENAKALASFEPMPEAAHNFVVGFENSANLAAVLPISFESTLYSQAIRRGFDVLEAVCARVGVPLHRIQTSGLSPLADMLEATAWGDCLSYYMAELSQLDPTPTETLDFIKGRMDALLAEG